MMTHPPKVEGVPLQQAGPDRTCQPGAAPEKHTVIEERTQTTDAGQSCRHGADGPCSATRHLHSPFGFDISREGANMLELQKRQSRCVTPLTLSSKATQALLRQF